MKAESRAAAGDEKGALRFYERALHLGLPPDLAAELKRAETEATRLRPGARITPHAGVHNARLICHLPLIVPPGCGFRVGNEVRQWEEGKLIIFDDAIEHEAWNDGDRDRVVLIFDVRRPELSARERQEVAALFAGPAMD